MAHPRIELPRPIECFSLFLIFMAFVGSALALYNFVDWHATSWLVLICSGIWLAWMASICWYKWLKFRRDAAQYGWHATLSRQLAKLSRRQLLYITDDDVPLLVHAGRLGSRVLTIEQMPVEDIMGIDEHGGQATSMGVKDARDFYVDIQMRETWRSWQGKSYYCLFLNLPRQQAHELVLNIEMLVRV